MSSRVNMVEGYPVSLYFVASDTGTFGVLNVGNINGRLQSHVNLLRVLPKLHVLLTVISSSN